MPLSQDVKYLVVTIKLAPYSNSKSNIPWNHVHCNGKKATYWCKSNFIILLTIFTISKFSFTEHYCTRILCGSYMKTELGMVRQTFSINS